MSNIVINSGGYVHVIDLTGLHVAPVLICKVIFVLDLSFCARSDLLIIVEEEKTQKERGCALNTNPLK